MRGPLLKKKSQRPRQKMFRLFLKIKTKTNSQLAVFVGESVTPMSTLGSRAQQAILLK